MTQAIEAAIVVGVILTCVVGAVWLSRPRWGNIEPMSDTEYWLRRVERNAGWKYHVEG